MKCLSVSICVFVVMVFFGLPVGYLPGYADDSVELSSELSQPSIDNQESFQLARVGNRKFVRRGIPAKSVSKFKGGVPRKSFPQKSFNLFPSRRINDLRHVQRPVFKEIDLKAMTLRVPRKDFVTPHKGILQRSRDVRRSINAQQGAVMKQFDTQRLRRQ